jgi:methyl coenzyme M reductase subunit C
MGNGQVIPVSNFEIEPEDVVQINKDQNLMIFLNNNENNEIEKVKVIEVDGRETELRATSNNAYPIKDL